MLLNLILMRGRSFEEAGAAGGGYRAHGIAVPGRSYSKNSTISASPDVNEPRR
jgi:hypothetical protein